MSAAGLGKFASLVRFRRQLVHASRMTAAGLGAYALIYLLGLPEGFWAMITAIVVTQSSIGGSLKMALDQAVGSLFGAIYATTVMLLIVPANHLETVLALIVALAPLSFLAVLFPGYRAAPITGVIMLLAGTGLGLGAIDLAAGRIIEVALGCAVGVVTSVLIVPARASRSVIETTAQVADLLAEQLQMMAGRTDNHQGEFGALARDLRRTMSQLERLVVEAGRERRAFLTDVPDVEPLLRTTSRLRHDVSTLRRFAREAGSEIIDEEITHAWRRAIRIGAERLEQIGRSQSGAKSTDQRDELSEAVRSYRQALDTARKSGVTESLSTAALTRLFGMSFALDQFRRNLDDLIDRYDEVTLRKPSRMRFQGVVTN